MRIGIDLGGTKIEGIVLGNEGEELTRRRMPTPQGDYDGTIASVREIVESLEAYVGGRCSIGVAMPGALSPASGLIKNANSTWLNGKPLDKDLTAALDREVRLANDANCFALSEAVDGAGKGFDVVFGVIVGTGCGGGVVIKGQVLRGAHAIAGEWGHNPLPWPDAFEHQTAPQCYCGKHGCLETWISGPAMAVDHSHVTGETLSAEDIADAAEDGDKAANATLARYADRMARGLATVINIIDPDVIVLGGGLSNIEALYELVPPRLSQYVFSDRVDVPVLQNKHGATSGVRGAAWLWPPEAS